MNNINEKNRTDLKEKIFMDIALSMASLSTCCRKKVGAILLSNERIISTGYNGIFSNAKHCNEYFNNKTNSQNFFNLHGAWSKVNELHAEQNCIAFAAKNGVSTDKCTLYVTVSPCIDCAKLIIASGISEVIYLEEYDRDKSGIELLKRASIPVRKITA